MKTFALTTALAIAVSLPAVAQTQLELSLGVEAGKYTLSQLADLKVRETESGNDGRTYFQETPAEITSQARNNLNATSSFEQQGGGTFHGE